MAKRQKRINDKRSVEQVITSDSQAKNLLSVKSGNYANSKINKSPKLIPTGKASKYKKALAARLTEKDLGIPKLNKSIDPEGIKIKGKKGKKFVEDNDAMMRILYSVSEKIDSDHASKLEKARQLEAIREARRKEMEKKEKEKDDKLSIKKRELKKRKKKDHSEDSDSKLSSAVGSSGRSTKKQVSFA